jgi:uncharacterized membrane protein YfcA
MYDETGRNFGRSAALALGAGAAVGVLGGLIGLGGAEFRLPILITVFTLPIHDAVRLNLLISLATVIASLGGRFAFASFPSLLGLVPELFAVTTGAVLAAWFGAGWLRRIESASLTKIVAGLLAVVGALLLAESVFGLDGGGGVSDEGSRLLVGFAAGLVIGLVSSMLGVAGGEFLIPTFMLVFGADVTTAGTASLVVSLPTVAVGVTRFWAQGSYRDRRVLLGIGAPMAIGSVVGALAGAALLAVTPVSVLKALLGGILLVSSMKLGRKHAR